MHYYLSLVSEKIHKRREEGHVTNPSTLHAFVFAHSLLLLCLSSSCSLFATADHLPVKLKMSGFNNLSAAEKEDMMVVMATLILHDDKVAISAENISKILAAAGAKVEPYRPKLFGEQIRGRG